jgi:hypothetical protein
MGWLDKKQGPAKAPTRWSPDLWSAASGSLSRFDMTVVIRAMGESGEWYYGNRRMSHDVEYRGTLDRMPEDPLGEMPVDLWFDTEPTRVALSSGTLRPSGSSTQVRTVTSVPGSRS